ncbi:MAG: SMI1/KNR4 family protein [Woeseiaceae bacterium]
MEYHSKTLDFIGKPLGIGNADEVAAGERRLGISFPVSVREWYTEVDGREILAKYSNDDPALSPTEFRLETVENRRLVIFLIENQGVCWWGFDLDSGDDPPVYVNLDPPPDKLFQYSQSFSEFTFVRVFDHEGFWDSERCSLDTFRPLSPGDLTSLRERFVEEPQSSGWPGNEVYRFRADQGRITIWQGDGQSDWRLSGHSPDALAKLKSVAAEICRPFD